MKEKNGNTKGEGGGEMSIMKGEVFEKVGVNISTVSGQFTEDYRHKIKGTEKSPNYWASGISLVAHMNSPKIPAFHFNTRFLITGESWFGGGADMTPTIVNQKDTKYFHSKMKDACNPHNEKYYSEFKKNVMNTFIYLIEKRLGERAAYFLIILILETGRKILLL